MGSLGEQISEWEAEERAHLVHQMRAPHGCAQDPACSAREAEAYAKVAVALSRTLSRAPDPSVARPAAAEQSSPLRRTDAEEADASGARGLLPAPPRTPTSPRRSLAQQGAAHSLRRRLMWEAERHAKQDRAAVRPRQCTTPREHFGDLGVSGGSVRLAAGTHSSPEDRAVCAALDLAYADGGFFFTHGGTVFRRSPSLKRSSPQAAKAHWSTTRGSGLRSPHSSPRPDTASSQDRPWR